MRRIGLWVVLSCVVLLGACANPQHGAVTLPVIVHEPVVQTVAASVTEVVAAPLVAVDQVPTVEEATVVRVSDGDTIVVSFDENGDGRRERVKVRLIGVSTPELGLPYSQMATEFLQNLVLNRTVLMEREGANEQPAFRYYPRRLLRHIYVDDAVTGTRIHVNGALVAAGFATSTPHGNKRYKKKFEMLEKEAREAKRGRWQKKPRNGRTTTLWRTLPERLHIRELIVNQ